MKMSEGKALALVFLGFGIVFFGACGALASLGAKNEAIILMALFLLVGGTQALGAVIHHYSNERRKQQK